MFALPTKVPAPGVPIPRRVLQRKCACGTCPRCADEKKGAQRKLAIGSSNDPLEHEADRIAEQVLSREPRSDFGTVPLSVRRHAPDEARQDEEAPPSVDQVLAMPGSPLDTPVRRDMEQRFGQDFSRVRVHHGAAAAQSASEVGALAYTVGSDIAFGQGQYAPGDGEGRRLLAHELAHVVQQNAGARLQRQSSKVAASTASAATEPKPAGICGPEVTDWLVRQVNEALANPKVVGIKAKILLANELALKNGTTTDDLIEGEVARRVETREEELEDAGKPPADTKSTPRPTKEIDAALKPSPRWSLINNLAPISTIKYYLKGAAEDWKDLVDHGHVYDFKAHVMKDPEATGCATPGCKSTVTICGGKPAESGGKPAESGGKLAEHCYLTDVPGNVAYALIGKYAGFSERALQLGSQWAQLGSKTGGAWDPPQDTASIRLGYSLPHPLSVTDLCKALTTDVHDSLNTKSPCLDCPLPTTAELK